MIYDVDCWDCNGSGDGQQLDVDRFDVCYRCGGSGCVQENDGLEDEEHPYLDEVPACILCDPHNWGVACSCPAIEPEWLEVEMPQRVSKSSPRRTEAA
jgi:hypothetical protein